jgi:hypothetical protein
VTQIIRKPAVAGSFYPANPVELTKTIAGFFAEVKKSELGGSPVALIAPHAGYMYSGKIAARAFKLLEGEEFDSVVIVAPSHTVFFKGSAVFDGDAYETPLGPVQIDKELSERIASINPTVHLSGQGHSTGSTRGEHSLEVQLPFLQIALGKFKLVAIVMGDQEEDSIRELGECLATAVKDTNTLIVASTDLSHFYTEKQARKLDFAVQEAIEAYNPENLIGVLESGKGEACGGGVVAAVMIATRRLGGKSVRFLDYNTSGAVTGDFDEVVGYLSAAIVADPRKEKVDITMGRPKSTPKSQPRSAETLTDEDKALLLRIAKDAVEAKLRRKAFTPPEHENLDFTQGAFVTITVNGELRGCIGQIRGREPIAGTIAEMAVQAAFEDPRFEPVTREELEVLTFEISILSPLKRVRAIGDIVVGKHGLLIKLDWHSGLLLPQVASENGWALDEFLEQTCLKAGLPKHGYKDKYAEIYSFTAVVFGGGEW